MSQQLETLGFGSGILFGAPTSGQLGANPTPVEIATLQNVKIDITADLKSLFGLYSFPVDSAVGKRMVKGSCAFAQFEGTTWNNLLFGQGGSVTAGAANIGNYRLAETIPSTTPYTITITPPSSGTYVADLGVRYATGEPLEAVASVAAAGEYSVDVTTGVYTFDASDDGKDVVITYSYSVAADGQTFSFGNLAMGTGPIVSLYLFLPYQSPSFSQLDRAIYLPNVRFGGLTLATKLDDYTEENATFEAYANPTTGQVIEAMLPW